MFAMAFDLGVADTASAEIGVLPAAVSGFGGDWLERDPHIGYERTTQRPNSWRT